ncbi:right-handed parallel beta-helix repeat-containing protein [Streptomyces sp. NPDC057382]|uniref:right-handed parallel beta-helix repeat-containing protein n=1 Tax=unclassified Streptomyces TaxID=2593676 RepID=UPI00362CE32A
MQWLNGLKLTPERLMDNTADETISSGLAVPTGWAVSSFQGTRVHGIVEVDIFVTRTGSDIGESSAGSGNISGDPLLCTLPSGWAPPRTVNTTWGNGSTDGEATIAPNGEVNLRSISGSGQIATGTNVRITQLWISEQPSGFAPELAEDVTSYAEVGVFWVTGAAGDGVSDDSYAIQAQLNAARDAGGGQVIVPPGVHAVAQLPLRIYRNTRLTLLDGATIRRAANGTMLLNGDADQAYGGYTGHGNIIIEGGTWDARAAAFPTSAMLISIGHAEGVTIRDTILKDVCGYHAIEMNSTKRGRIINVTALGYKDPDGTRDFSEAFQFDLAKGSAYFGGFGPYDDTPCVDVLVEHCHVGPSGTAGTTSWPRAVGSHSASPSKQHTGIVIRDLYCDSLTQWAIGGYTWQDTVVSGVILKSCGAGVWMRTLDSSKSTHRTPAGGGAPTIAGSQALRNVVVEDVVMYGGGSYDAAVRIEGEDTGYIQGARISGIVVRDVGSQAVRLVDVEDYVIDEVVARGCGATAVSTLGTRRGRITAHVNGATGAGITVDSRSTPAATATNVTVSRSSVTGTTANGIHVWDGTDVTIDDCEAYSLTGYGVQISTNTVRPVLRKNRTRDTTLAGINITNTVTGVRRYGNTPGSVTDASTSPSTSPFDSGANIIAPAIKPGDTGRASTIAPAADPDLTLPVEAGGIYDVECVAVWTTGGGGFRATWAAPAGATMAWTDNDGVGASTAGAVVTFASGTGTTFKGTLVVGATAGSLTLSWAQNTSNAAATTLKAGSALKLTRLA